MHKQRNSARAKTIFEKIQLLEAGKEADVPISARIKLSHSGYAELMHLLKLHNAEWFAFSRLKLSYDQTREAAERGAYDQWRGNIFPNNMLTELRMPDQFDAAGDLVNPAVILKMVRVSAEPEEHLAWLQADLDLGFERLMLHNVNLEQERFIDDFGAKVLPTLLKR